ncbi:MAG: YdcF family protein [Proteobacteria bacterium]|nr:YdcF family protein [Pseudomonadota bacterium]
MRRVVLAVFGLAGLGLALLGGGFAVFVESLSRQDTEFGRPVDGIAALTGGAERIGDALMVLEEGRAKRLLISGVGAPVTEKALIRQAGHADLFLCCVDLGREALNTVGNAVETAAWVRRNNYKSLLLVTSNYHMPRAMVELRRHLKDVHIIPHPVITDAVSVTNWWRDPALFRLLFTEYLKYLASEVRSRVIPDNPKTRAPA